MTYTQEDRLAAYASLPPELQELYSSDTSNIFHTDLVKHHGINPDVEMLYSDIIGDVILGFYKTSQLPQLFQDQIGVDVTTAFQMTAELLEFLSPIIAREEAIMNGTVSPIAIEKVTPTETPTDAVTTGTSPLINLLNQTPAAPTPLEPVMSAPEPTVPTPQPPMAPAPFTTPEPAAATGYESTPQTPEPLTAAPENLDHVHGYGAYREQYRYGEEPEKIDPAIVQAADQDALLRRRAQ